MTSPTILSGVDAPAVTASVHGSRAGSQSRVSVSFPGRAPGGRCRMASTSRQEGSAIWYVATRSAQIRARLRVLLLL